MALLTQAKSLSVMLLLALLIPPNESHWAISCHSFIATLLLRIRSEPTLLKFLEPIAIPDIITSSFEMKNVSFHGLKSLHTQGPCVVMRAKNITSLDFGVGLKNITYEGEYSMKLLMLWISGTVRGTIEQMTAEMGVTLDNNNREPKVNRLNVTQLGDFQVNQINGASWMFNWALKGIATHFAQSSREAIKVDIENKTRIFTEWLLSKLTIPMMLMDALGNIVDVLP